MSTPVSREEVHHEIEHIDHRPATLQRRFDANNSRSRRIDHFLQDAAQEIDVGTTGILWRELDILAQRTRKFDRLDRLFDNLFGLQAQLLLHVNRRGGDEGVDDICRRAMLALSHVGADDSVYVGGAASMASAFDAVDVVRQVLQTLEQQYLVVTLVRDILDRGLSVSIGAEHGIEPLASCSVVVSPVVVDGEQMGTVGVLGPTRMDYRQALATVAVVSDRLGRRLGEG